MYSLDTVAFTKGLSALTEKTGRIYISRDVNFYDNMFPFSVDSALPTITHSTLLENQILFPSIALHPSPTEPDLMSNQQRYVEPDVINNYASEDLVTGEREQDVSADPVHEQIFVDEAPESVPQLQT
jgi:hypothetical protein